MKFLGLLVALMLVFIPTGALSAATTQDIAVDAAPAYVSISNSPETWNVDGGSAVGEGSTYNTGLAYFNVTSSSGGAIDINIRGTDMIGGGYTWLLSDTATPGDMVYGLMAGINASAIVPVDRLDVSPGNVDSWINNLSAGVEDGAEGIHCEVVNTSGSTAYAWGLRMGIKNLYSNKL